MAQRSLVAAAFNGGACKLALPGLNPAICRPLRPVGGSGRMAALKAYPMRLGSLAAPCSTNCYVCLPRAHHWRSGSHKTGDAVCVGLSACSQPGKRERVRGHSSARLRSKQIVVGCS